MFETNGEFGKTRIADGVYSERDQQTLFCASRVFWHDCNDRYGLTRESGADNHIVLLTVSGCGLLEIAGRSYVLKEGTAAIIGFGTPHSYRCAPGASWVFYGVHIHNNFASALLKRAVEENGICFQHAAPDALVDLLEHFMLNIKNNAKQCNYDNSLLLSEFIHELFKVKRAENVNHKNVGAFEQAIAYIEQNYANPLDINELCTRLFLSPSHFIRIFRKYFSMTPYQYIERYRIVQARILLCQTQMCVADVAHAVGYKSASNFILYFKKHVGVTPAAYRKDPKRYEMAEDNFNKQLTYMPLPSTISDS